MRRLIKYMIPLLSAVLLTVALSFAWFVMQAKVTSDIVVQVGNVKFDYTLYQYSGNTWVEKDRVTNGVKHSTFENCQFSRILPGDVSYFMIKVNPTDSLSFSARFDNVESNLDTTKILYQDNAIYSNVNSNLFKLYDCPLGSVEVLGKTLYTVNDGVLSLGDYLIENTYYSYLCDVSDNIDVNTYVPSLSGDAKLLNESFISHENVLANTDKYFVFALEFNEELSIVDDSSNCYMYQILNIGSIYLTGYQSGGNE